MAPSKMLADLQNVGAFQNIGGCTKCWRFPKYWWMYKMLASGRNIGRRQNLGGRWNLRAWWNISGSGKSWRPAYCLGSAESPTADFLLDWLKSSRFMDGVLPYCTNCLYRPDMPKHTQKSKLLAAAHIFTNSCENSKILSQLLSVLALSRKLLHDHCCCPISAIILTASKLEAILNFWRGYRKNVPNDMGGGGGERGLRGEGGPCERSSACAGHESASSLRLYSWWHHSCYQSIVSFLLLHLSLYRSRLGGSRWKCSHHGCKTTTVFTLLTI